MVDKVDTAVINLCGNEVGAVSWLQDRGYAVFEYDKDFLKLGLDISPIHMNVDEARRGDAVFTFPALNKTTFLGLPGMLADSLPDKFGNSIIDAWLARQGRDANDFSPIERLCYMGKRGMGALEFVPALIDQYDASVPVEISDLIKLADEVIKERKQLDVNLGACEKLNADAITDILRVGTSAGGARPKAIIALNGDGHILSGQAMAPKDYDYWILKFDGVSDLELGESRGYGRIEYAYYLMAKAAGISMTECRLLQENGRAHFMTKRFDRINGNKIHMQSLCGLAHYDYNMAGAYSYEQAFEIMRKLHLDKADTTEQFRRMVFNIMARDLDDHTKNISFLMDIDGLWKLSPAYDVIYSHNPKGKWTNQHQMSLNGKRDHFVLNDFIKVAQSIGIKSPEIIINDVVNSMEKWPTFAKDAGVKKDIIDEIAKNHLSKI